MKENSFLFRSEAYKRSVPQFSSEEALHPYYLQYSGREVEENVYNFWRAQTLKVMENVFCSFVVLYGDLQDFFVIHSRIPLPLPRVIFEMKKDGIISICQNLDEWKVQKQQKRPEAPGLVKRVYGYFSSWFSSEKPSELVKSMKASTKIINVGLVEKLSQKILTQLQLKEFQKAQGLISQSTLKRLALETLELEYDAVERDFIINYLLRSDYLGQSVLNIDNEEIKIFKIQKRSNSKSISELDKAHFMIQLNIERLSQKIAGLEEKHNEMTTQAKRAINQKRIDFAKLVLQSRKKLEKHQEHLHILLFELEKQKIALSASQSNSNLYTTLKQAEQAMKQTTVKAQQIEEVVHSLEERKLEQEEIADFVKKQADSQFNDAAILKELEAEFEQQKGAGSIDINLPNAPKGKVEQKVKAKEAVLIS